MKRRKHKKGCRCVACSPATRKRGMAALRNALRKARSKRRRHVVRSFKRRGGGVSAYQRKGARVKRHWSNPGHGAYIGSNVRLHPGRHHVGSKLYCGNAAGEVVLKGCGAWPRVGTRVRRADYDNRPKALRSYGRPGRFKHDFTSPVTVARVVTLPGNQWLAMLRSQSNIWKRG